jgi:hypothetical protein
MIVSPVAPHGKSVAGEVIAACKISSVFHALTGTVPRRTGRNTWRAPAVYRGGDGKDAVSGDDARGLWHDFVSGEGGGILDLVARIRGGSKREALGWLAEFAGYRLDERPLSLAERNKWAQQQLTLKHELPKARHWRRAAVDMAEALLDELKSTFFDPIAEDRPSSMELQELTRQVARLQRIDGLDLVTEYRSWMEEQPTLTSSMVLAAQTRHVATERALKVYLNMTAVEGHRA